MSLPNRSQKVCKITSVAHSALRTCSRRQVAMSQEMQPISKSSPWSLLRRPIQEGRLRKLFGFLEVHVEVPGHLQGAVQSRPCLDSLGLSFFPRLRFPVIGLDFHDRQLLPHLFIPVFHCKDEVVSGGLGFEFPEDLCCRDGNATGNECPDGFASRVME